MRWVDFAKRTGRASGAPPLVARPRPRRRPKRRLSEDEAEYRVFAAAAGAAIAALVGLVAVLASQLP